MSQAKQWLSFHERAGRCRKWRKARVREAAGKKQKHLRQVLGICAGLEFLYLIQQYYQEQNLNFQIFRIEESYHIEWGNENPLIPEQSFGIRLNLEELELEFYHQTRKSQKQVMP